MASLFQLDQNRPVFLRHHSGDLMTSEDGGSFSELYNSRRDGVLEVVGTHLNPDSQKHVSRLIFLIEIVFPAC